MTPLPYLLTLFIVLNIRFEIVPLSRIGNVLRNMINPRISAYWSTTKTIAAFSCTPRVQEVHTKAEVLNLTPGLLGLALLLNCHA